MKSIGREAAKGEGGNRTRSGLMEKNPKQSKTDYLILNCTLFGSVFGVGLNLPLL